MQKKNNNLEEDIKRLEEIVSSMESGVDIEDAVKLYEEGIKLHGKLQARLTTIERKVFEVKNISKLDANDETLPDLELFSKD